VAGLFEEGFADFNGGGPGIVKRDDFFGVFGEWLNGQGGEGVGRLLEDLFVDIFIGDKEVDVDVGGLLLNLFGDGDVGVDVPA